MYTLNFPNGNSQTYNSVSELMNAARALGGTAKCVGNKVYAFVARQLKRCACAEKGTRTGFVASRNNGSREDEMARWLHDFKEIAAKYGVSILVVTELGKKENL